MKIAVIGVKGIPAKQGGIEHYCQELYPRIVAQGHEVDLFARPSYTEKPWFSSYKHEGVRVISLPSLPLRGLDAFFNSAFGAMVSLFGNYDIVHFHALGPSLFCWLPRLFTSARVVVTCQGLDWQRAKWGKLSSTLIRMGEKAAVKYAHEIAVVSKDLQAYFRNTYGIETDYISNAPGKYAESDPKLSYSQSLGLESGRYLLFLGRLVPEKRPELLLEAFQKLQPKGWKLVLAGGNSDTTDYITKLENIAAGNPNVVFTGELKGAKLAEIVRGTGLFVLPSDLEGLPLAMLEAMREGVPVLASDIPPHRQVIGKDEARGLLFKAGSMSSLLESLKRAISEPQKLSEIAQKAQQHVRANHNWKKTTYENLALYARIAGTGIKPVISKKIQTTDKQQRIQACLQELSSLLYEDLLTQASTIKQTTDQERLEHTLREQLSEKINAQVELVLSDRLRKVQQVSLRK